MPYEYNGKGDAMISFTDGCKFLVLIIAMSSVLAGCSKDSPTESSQYFQMSWNRAVYAGDSTLTITELWGPSGASVTNIIPGKYKARGTYDLTRTNMTTGTISLGFAGTIVTMKNDRRAEHADYSIPEGQLTGTYETVQEILEIKNGPNNPIIENPMLGDRIILY